MWSWPGDTSDSGLIRQVREDIRRALSRVIWVADRGFTSTANRRALMQGGGGYIIGEKLRSGSGPVKAALSRQGRYAVVKDSMQVKEVSIGTDDRFVLCFNPAQAERDAAIRGKLVTQLEELIKDTDTLPATERARIEGSLAEARPQAVPAHNARRAAAHRQAEVSGPRRTWTASTCCAAPTRT